MKVNNEIFNKIKNGKPLSENDLIILRKNVSDAINEGKHYFENKIKIDDNFSEYDSDDYIFSKVGKSFIYHGVSYPVKIRKDYSYSDREDWKEAYIDIKDYNSFDDLFNNRLNYIFSNAEGIRTNIDKHKVISDYLSENELPNEVSEALSDYGAIINNEIIEFINKIKVYFEEGK